jgi:phospholipase/carboxylesterase
MKHVFIKGLSEKTLLLLHGTGGNEEDLIPLAKHIDHEANILSVRGNVLEYGMPRFFKRLAMGVFDLESLAEETENLYQFLKESAINYQFDINQVIAVGYSNGANMALSLLFSYDKPFEKAILFHPMIPRRDMELPNMKNLPIFIGAGSNDHMVSYNETHELKDMLRKQGAIVKINWTNQGHTLNKDEIFAAKQWYDQVK